jgi:hypothetical protein
VKLAVLSSIRGHVRNGRFVTDRANRYRAQAHATGKRCFACGAPNPRDVHHLDGHESNDHPSNISRCCRSCNTRIANVMRKAGLGTKTRQYNPRSKARSHGSRSLGSYLSAVQIVKGEQPGNVSAAVRDLQATSPSQRSEYAEQIWKIRKERYGPTGRRDTLPF